MERRLKRDTRQAFLGGVAAGFARYFDVDPVLARLGFVFLTFIHGAGVILYLICWVVMPAEEGTPSASAPPPGGRPISRGPGPRHPPGG